MYWFTSGTSFPVNWFTVTISESPSIRREAGELLGIYNVTSLRYLVYTNMTVVLEKLPDIICVIYGQGNATVTNVIAS